jgi:hypothetical protein
VTYLPDDGTPAEDRVLEVENGLVAEFDFKPKPADTFKHLLHAPTWIYMAYLGSCSVTDPS